MKRPKPLKQSKNDVVYALLAVTKDYMGNHKQTGGNNVYNNVYHDNKKVYLELFNKYISYF